MKKITNLLLISGFVLGFSTCAFADITWTFNNVSFCLSCGQTDETDNSITSGSWFTTDSSGDVTGWDITVTGTNAGADNEYTPLDSFRTNPMDPNHIDLYDGSAGPFGEYLDLFFDSPGITSAGGVVNLLLGDAGADANSTIACTGCSVLVSGSVTGSDTVPEPRMGALVAGLIGLGIIGRRKVFQHRA